MDLPENHPSLAPPKPIIGLTLNSQKKMIESLILSDLWMFEILKAVNNISTHKLWVSGGFVRNKVWDLMHSYQLSTPLDDVDVVYFDSNNTSEEADGRLEQLLREQMHNIPWSVKNQARMHTRNKDAPYTSLEDALRKWPETATAIAVSLSEGKEGLEFVVSAATQNQPRRAT